MLAAVLNRIIERARPWYLRWAYFKLFPERKPIYFSDCWNLPEFSPPLAGKTKNLAVIFLPMNDWHTRIQRSQHLARELARRGFPVIYVNPHLGREFPEIYQSRHAERLMQIETNLLELHVHLPREPVFHHRLLTDDESKRIARALTNALRSVGVSRAVQVAALPIWLEAAQEIRTRHGAPLIYDCHDFLPGFSNIAPEIVEHEADLFQASDRVICTSASLMERAGAATSSPRSLLRNAAATDFFAPRREASPEVTIGYAGALDSWFDVEAVAYAAEARPDWHFQLIGRVENEAIAALSKFRNIQLTGEVAFADLPQRLSRFRVATIPFRLNPLIEATDPIKAYEYLACGLPVIASEMPELKRFGELISFYRTPAEFVARVEQAIGPETVEIRERRREFVQNETWETRGAQLAELIENL